MLKTTACTPINTYPKLVRNDRNGCILLVTSESNGKYTGVCVHSPYEKKHLGEYSDEWFAKGFTNYQGSVTIGQG